MYDTAATNVSAQSICIDDSQSNISQDVHKFIIPNTVFHNFTLIQFHHLQFVLYDVLKKFYDICHNGPIERKVVAVWYIICKTKCSFTSYHIISP